MTRYVRNIGYRFRYALAQRPDEMYMSMSMLVGGSLQLGFQQYLPSLVHLMGSYTILWCLYLVVGASCLLAGIGSGTKSLENLGLTLSAIGLAVCAIGCMVFGGIMLALAGALFLGVAALFTARLFASRRGQA